MTTPIYPLDPAADGDASEHPGGRAGRSAVVFGATGFIGRWLVKELLDAGVPVTAVVRSESSGAMLRAWLAEHGAGGGLTLARADLARDDLGWSGPHAPVATEVYNMAG